MAKKRAGVDLVALGDMAGPAALWALALVALMAFTLRDRLETLRGYQRAADLSDALAVYAADTSNAIDAAAREPIPRPALDWFGDQLGKSRNAAPAGFKVKTRSGEATVRLLAPERIDLPVFPSACAPKTLQMVEALVSRDQEDGPRSLVFARYLGTPSIWCMYDAHWILYEPEAGIPWKYWPDEIPFQLSQTLRNFGIDSTDAEAGVERLATLADQDRYSIPGLNVKVPTGLWMLALTAASLANGLRVVLHRVLVKPQRETQRLPLHGLRWAYAAIAYGGATLAPIVVLGLDFYWIAGFHGLGDLFVIAGDFYRLLEYVLLSSVVGVGSFYLAYLVHAERRAQAALSGAPASLRRRRKTTAENALDEAGDGAGGDGG